MENPEATSRHPRRRARFRLAAAVAALALLALAGACGHRRVAPPTVDSPPSPPPDLGGRSVMVLPAQAAASTPASLATAFDHEAAYWLADRAPRVKWTFPPQLEQALAEAPGLGIDVHALAVGQFSRMRVQSIGDPLFGDLRRLGAVADARYALLPTRLVLVPATPPATGVTLEVAAALIDTMGGDVLWFGVVRGETGDVQDAAVPATAARALARALIP